MRLRFIELLSKQQQKSIGGKKVKLKGYLTIMNWNLFPPIHTKAVNNPLGSWKKYGKYCHKQKF